jgi:hypothetical protein
MDDRQRGVAAPWIIAGGIVIAGLIVGGTIVFVNRSSPTPTPSPSPTAATPTASPSPTGSPTGSPTPPPTAEINATARTFYEAWVADDSGRAATVGRPVAVHMAFLVPLSGRSHTRLRGCTPNADLGPGAYQCPIVDRASDIAIASEVVRPLAGTFRVTGFLFHAD